MKKISSSPTKTRKAKAIAPTKKRDRIGEESRESGQTIAQASGAIESAPESSAGLSEAELVRLIHLARLALRNWRHSQAIAEKESFDCFLRSKREEIAFQSLENGRKAIAQQWRAIGLPQSAPQDTGEQYGPALSDCLADSVADCVSPIGREYLWREVREMFRDDSPKNLVAFSPMVGHSGRTIFVRADCVKVRGIVAEQSAECDLYRAKILAIPYQCRAGQRIGARHTGNVVLANDGNGETSIVSRELAFVAIQGADRLRDSDSQLFADTVARKREAYIEIDNGIWPEVRTIYDLPIVHKKTTIVEFVPRLKTRTIKRVISRTVEGEGTSKRTRKVQVSIRELEIARDLNLESREYRYREILRARLWNWSRAVPDSVKGDYVYSQPKKNGSPETKRLLPIVVTKTNGEYRSRRAARIGKKTQAKTSFVGFFLPGNKPKAIVARYDLAEQFPATRGPREYLSEWPESFRHSEPIAPTEQQWFDSEKAQQAIEYLTGRLQVRHTGDARILARKRAEGIVDSLLAGCSVLRCSAENNLPERTLGNWLTQLAETMPKTTL